MQFINLLSLLKTAESEPSTLMSVFLSHWYGCDGPLAASISSSMGIFAFGGPNGAIEFPYSSGYGQYACKLNYQSQKKTIN